MKIGRFLIDGAARSGIVKGGKAIIDGKELNLEELKFLPPSIPRKIVCVGLNYVEHARELGMKKPKEPVLFLKPDSALNSHNGKVLLPRQSGAVDYEAELALVIGKKCKNVQKEDCEDFVLGLTCFNDVTARDIQAKDVQWTRAKGFDTFAPAGPWIATCDEFSDLEELSLDVALIKNSAKMQSSNTRSLIFHIPFLIEFISEVMTLEEGDIISTGSPPGVGNLEDGDVMDVSIEGIGTLRNYVGLESR
jgi:2-keto-4-pentenoate hydratase/2-oxohepta-3-ene-1,7-dioic acid hydratase in catechol pathway